MWANPRIKPMVPVRKPKSKTYEEMYKNLQTLPVPDYFKKALMPLDPDGIVWISQKDPMTLYVRPSRNDKDLILKMKEALYLHLVMGTIVKFVDEETGVGDTHENPLDTFTTTDGMKLFDNFSFEEEKAEMVNHPAHYGGEDNPYEAIKVIEAWDLGFNLGNSCKYLSRVGKKGDDIEDLDKMIWYAIRERDNRKKARVKAERKANQPKIMKG